MKGIMFIEELFTRVVDCEKTQTRRVIKGLIPDEIREKGKIIFLHWQTKPRYKKGDIVYLKEPYSFSRPVISKNKNITSINVDYSYEPKMSMTIKNPDIELSDDLLKPHNKMFMPERYCRYKIKFTKVWVERLNEISEEDAIKEGVAWLNDVRKDTRKYKNYANGRYSLSTAKKSYMSLLEKINGSIFLKENPPIWCYQFHLL